MHTRSQIVLQDHSDMQVDADQHAIYHHEANMNEDLKELYEEPSRLEMLIDDQKVQSDVEISSENKSEKKRRREE